jgi:predicted DsbA family dithiol-disulfide isomerase
MKIEIWSDFVCPFCYIGKRRLEEALQKFDGVRPEIVFKSYELDPKAPIDADETMLELLSTKYQMSQSQAQQMIDGVIEQAASVGLEFNFSTMKRTNTFDAHRLAKFAYDKGKGPELTERLLLAYFTEGKHIGDQQTLMELANEVGMDVLEAEAILKSDQYKDDVLKDESEARQIGIQGVPYFIFNQKLVISGARSSDEFLEALRQSTAENPAESPIKTGDSCSDERC